MKEKKINYELLIATGLVAGMTLVTGGFVNNYRNVDEKPIMVTEESNTKEEIRVYNAGDVIKALSEETRLDVLGVNYNYPLRLEQGNFLTKREQTVNVLCIGQYSIPLDSLNENNVIINGSNIILYLPTPSIEAYVDDYIVGNVNKPWYSIKDEIQLTTDEIKAINDKVLIKCGEYMREDVNMNLAKEKGQESIEHMLNLFTKQGYKVSINWIG